MSNNNNINIVFLLLFLICVACSNEELIEQKGEATFSIVLSTKQNVVSKADEEESTVPGGDPMIATKEELRIKDYVIVVFANKEGSMERLDYRSGTPEGDGSSVTIEKLKATVDNDITIIAIANAGVGAYKDLGYEALKEQIVEGSHEKLIKVGINEGIKLKKNNQTIEIYLTQLTARVDVNIKTAAGSSDGTGWNFEMTKMSIYNINNKSDLIIDNGNTQWEYAEVLDLKKNAEGRYTFYTYEQNPDAHDPIKIEVTGKMVYRKSGSDDVTIPKSYYMELNPKKSTDGDAIKSDGVLHGNYYDVTGVIKPESAFIIKWYIQEKGIIEIDVPPFE